jgi:hypothetical protein
VSRFCRLTLSLVLLLISVGGSIVPVGALPLPSAQKASATILLEQPLTWLLEVARSLFLTSCSASQLSTQTPYGSDNPQTNLLP